MMGNFSDCERFQIALLPSVYGLEFVLALAGNLLALWLMVVRERRNWHNGVVLSCNLAISDLLYVLTLPLLIIYYSRGKYWMFGDAVCKIERFLFTCNLYVSIFFIMAISVNRCVALMWPFFARAHVQPVHAKAISVVIWITVGVISCPVLKFASVCVHDNKIHCVSICDTQVVGRDVTFHFVYKILLFVIGCLIPFLVTSTSYCAVIWVVWRNVNITTLQKQKVALLVTSVLVMYAISFMPYNVLQILHFYLKIHNKSNSSQCLIYDMYQVSKGLAALNMCIHPILYMALFDSIRVACCGKRLEDNNKIEANKQTCL
uniref:G-protein coupled receptors family 1 profile domain-containing protein n=1 Tax=Mola mola TaxID=94237 RepID=A0A3Q3WRW7_MOLML